MTAKGLSKTDKATLTGVVKHLGRISHAAKSIKAATPNPLEEKVNKLTDLFTGLKKQLDEAMPKR